MTGFKIPDSLPFSGGEMKVELDKRSLFALASDTRLEMLKALESNRRTVSQLAEVLQIDKAAVHRHLKKLEEGGFVTRTEDHGFVYYALTWKSRDILNPNDKTKIIILISSSAVCFLAMAIMVYMVLSSSGLSMAGMPAEQKSGEFTNQEPQTDQTAGPSTPVMDLTVPFILLGIGAAVTLTSAYLVSRTPRQKGGEEKEILQAALQRPGED
jgi:DNA-binding transcriptional ArsR family regulator